MSVGEKFRRLGADTIWYGLTGALSKSVALLLLPIYARVLAPSEFGVFDLGMVAVTVMSLIMGLELHGALKRYYFEGDDDHRAKLVSSLYAAVIVIGLTAAIVMTLAFMFLREMGLLETGIAGALFVAVGAALFRSILSLSEVQLRMERRVGHFAVIQTINLLVSGSASLFFLIYMGWGVVGILLGYTLGAAAAAAVGTWWVADRLRLRFDWPLLKRAISYAAPLVPSVASGYLRRFGDRVVILAFLPVASLGVYALGYRIAMIPMLFITAFQMSWSPLAMSLLGDPDQEEVYCRALRYYALLVGGFGMVIAAFAPEIVRILGTETYASAIPLVGWIVGAVILHGAGTFVTVGAMVAERTSIHLKGSLVGGLSALIVMAGLVPLLGLLGAAVGAFAGALLGRVVTYALSQRVYRLRYDGTRIAVIIGLFVAMQAVLLPFSHVVGTGNALVNRVGILVLCLGITGSVLLDSKDRRRLKLMLSWG